MFELSVASKYLIPRRRQLSVSIISLISVIVIALVVWLIVVFFSVTDGLEKSWVQKLTALTAPVRLTPTEHYYHSYYYLADSISESSDYQLKTIAEKKDASVSDPYQPDRDEQIPEFWAHPDKNSEGELKDLVQLAYAAVDEIKGVKNVAAHDYELTASHIYLGLQREEAVLHPGNFYAGNKQSSLSYPAFLGNYNEANSQFQRTLLPLEASDLNNYLNGMAYIHQAVPSEEMSDRKLVSFEIFQNRLNTFMQAVTIESVRPKPFGWTIPLSIYPQEAAWHACALFRDQTITRLVIPAQKTGAEQLERFFKEQGLKTECGAVSFNNGQVFWTANGQNPILLPNHAPLTLMENRGFKGSFNGELSSHAKKSDEIQLDIEVTLQGTLLKGAVPLRGLEIETFKIDESKPAPWIYRDHDLLILPQNEEEGEGILLPKSFREAGVRIGDRGSLNYFAPTVSLLQEHDIPVFVAGFYDPGIIPIGGKFIIANPSVTALIRASHQPDDKTAVTNGINVRFEPIDKAEIIKNQLVASLTDKGINRYWNVETYQEYEFAKEIMQELQSQKHLFMLIAIVIILVACSNIISMLIILVNDKKNEIGILRAMGASSKSIAMIFGLAGAAIGIFGSILGIALAIFTLHNLDHLVGLLSSLQGHDMFSSSLYGKVLPSELSYEALLFVLGATLLVSLLAGIVPAVKACLVRPSTTLRSGG